jgi:hypothetical protein
MDTLPEYFGIFRPGYGVHKYITLVKNIQTILEDMIWNSIDFIPIEGAKYKRINIPKTLYKLSRVCYTKPPQGSFSFDFLKDGSEYKYLPYEIITSDNKRYPVIFFKTTGFLPTIVYSSEHKYMLSDEEIEDTKRKMLEYGVLGDEESRPVVKSPLLTPTTTPIFVIQNHLENERNKNVDCSITLKPLKECKELSVLSCFHIFDKDSILEYRETNKKCPICRNESSIIHNATF